MKLKFKLGKNTIIFQIAPLPKKPLTARERAILAFLNPPRPSYLERYTLWKTEFEGLLKWKYYGLQIKVRDVIRRIQNKITGKRTLCDLYHANIEYENSHLDEFAEDFKPHAVYRFHKKTQP